MEILVPNKTDWEKVNRLAVQVHELHVGWRPDIFLSSEIVIDKERFFDLIENTQIFVAKENEDILGYITFDIKERENPIMRFRKQLSIDAMCVDEKCRHKGIGTKLLGFVKEYALKNNCTDLYLTVNEENIPGIKTYEKFGFRVKNIAYSMQIKKDENE